MKVLAVTAHPDDCVIFAGTLLKLKEEFNANIMEITLTKGEENDFNNEREEEMKKVSKFLGYTHKFLNGKDFNLFRDKNLILQLIKEIRDFKPDIVITLPPYDYHNDHRLTFSITEEAVRFARTGFRPDLGEKHRVSLFIYADSLHLLKRPVLYFDITNYFNKKIEAWQMFASQKDDKITRLLEGTALRRGAEINVKYAEAFEIYEYSPVNFDSLVNLFKSVRTKDV